MYGGDEKFVVSNDQYRDNEFELLKAPLRKDFPLELPNEAAYKEMKTRVFKSFDIVDGKLIFTPTTSVK